MKQHVLPDTDSIEELARFWDTHDLTDFEGLLEEVREPVFARAKRSSLRVDLAPREAGRVKRIARSKGVDEGTVLRQWILEKLQEHATGRSPDGSPEATAHRRRRS
jgi:hypothetical protein